MRRWPTSSRSSPRQQATAKQRCYGRGRHRFPIPSPACRNVHAQIDLQILAPLQLPDPLPLEAVLTPFINLLARLSQPFTLVLDDYHFITEAAIHRTLRLLLDQLPP